MTNSTPAPFGTMSRDHVFCLAAWLVHARGQYDREADAAIGVVLEKLVACFPEEPSDPPIGALHRRLARGSSPESIRQFLAWLYGSARAGVGLAASEGAGWAYARCWSEVEAIMTEVPRRPRTATPPNPWLHRVTPELAWEALRRLTAPLDQRGSADQVKQDELAIQAVLGRWRRLETWRNWVTYCPACSTELSLLRDPLHISRCHCHPAHRRLAAARKALGAVATAPPGGSAELAVEPKSRFPTYISDYEVEKTLAQLVAGGRADELPGFTDLESVLIEWERSQPAYRFVCPDCGESSTIRDAREHLMTCPRHPAALAAAELEKELQARSGAGARALLEVTAQCESFRSMLSLLSQATEHFAARLHWSREGLYSKSIDEGPWRAMQKRAQQLLSSHAPSDATSDGRDPWPIAEPGNERDAYAHALARLVEANQAYWSAMREGEGGRSLQDEKQVPSWEAARAAARELLGAAQSGDE